jgi:hypothetical protein
VDKNETRIARMLGLGFAGVFALAMALTALTY